MEFQIPHKTNANDRRLLSYNTYFECFERMDIIYIQDEPWEEPRPFQVPKWWECQWRRVGCGAKNCPMCGDFDEYIKNLENRSQEKLLSETDSQTIFEQAELGAFKEAILNESILDQQLNEEEYDEWLNKQPNLTEHPLYQKIRSWSDPLLKLIDQAEQNNEPWTKIESSLDLGWYASLMRGKVYRLLFDRWELDHENKHMDVDYLYTRYVLSESLNIIKESINTLLPQVSHKVEFITAASKIVRLEWEILNI